ncbi:MAG TPA: ABC transporter permease [Thermoanaerobaculia bacterium]|nr:ABC transporter permease [Thermoanaerobaculia bacterium]
MIANREYLSRIKSKGFWLATILLPLFLVTLGVVPVLILARTTSRLAAVLVDETGVLGPAIAERLAEGATTFGPAAHLDLELTAPAADRVTQRAELDRRLLDEETDAWIWLDREGLAEGRVEYHARNVSNTLTQELLEAAISTEVQKLRLVEAGFDPEVVEPLLEPVSLRTVKVSASGSRDEAGEAGFLLAYGLFFLLYMVLLIWGQQVLTGVLEEKSSRVVEVIVSSARPFDLMLGKLIGIGGAALTQFGIWLATAVALTAPGLLSMLGSLPEDAGLPSFSATQALAVVVFFLLGFFVFASMFAAVGASFNNAQEAQQLSFLPTAFIILPIFFLFPVINDSSGTLAVVTSLVPPLTPILMPLRIAVEMPPLWQIGLAVVLTSLFVYFMVRLCGRIYRVGILMYGKKPTVKEIWRWVRYA